MDTYIKNKKDMKFQSQEALKSVEDLLNEANAALNDKSRTIEKSYLDDSVVGRNADGTSALAAGSLVGGMAAGIAILAVPVAILGGLGIGAAVYVKNKKLKEAKELCYKEAIRKQNAIIKALKEEVNADKERIEYLNSVNTLLQSAIKDLKYDLSIS